ncbi:endophilin-B2 isoform X6 [Drosophila ficusphila]|uniref:endophilin-B2 isoform X6 n=1 Tax=Drosophila ficusphila TaxID=30025 RepID=UPI0007E79E2C|nr:endophilin-B2 isoform X6 [Drosophila ficusphila]
MNINLPNFNVKNLVKEAGSTISRVVQLTEEKLGTTERTEYDVHFQNLAERADVTKTWTEKIVRDTESVLIPNPQNRVEDFIFEKIEKSKPKRLSNLEHLALDMIEAGGDFGQDLPYGQALIKVGQAEQKLGQCEHDFIATSGGARSAGSPGRVRPAVGDHQATAGRDQHLPSLALAPLARIRPDAGALLQAVRRCHGTAPTGAGQNAASQATPAHQ